MPPTWREVVLAVAGSRNMRLSEDQVAALIKGCEAAGDRDAALSYLEKQFAACWGDPAGSWIIEYLMNRPASESSKGDE